MSGDRMRKRRDAFVWHTGEKPPANPMFPVRLELPGGWSGFLSESRHPGIWVANVHGADGTVSAFGVNPFDASQRAHAAVAAILALRPRTEDVDEPEVIL